MGDGGWGKEKKRFHYDLPLSPPSSLSPSCLKGLKGRGMDPTSTTAVVVRRLENKDGATEKF